MMGKVDTAMELAKANVRQQSQEPPQTAPIEQIEPNESVQGIEGCELKCVNKCEQK